MSVKDERDLRAQLGSALDGLTPGSLPLQAVVRQGRAMIIRRRVTAAIAVAAVVIATAVAVPLLAGRPGQPGPAGQSRHYHVTVYPPGPGAPKGLIASGRIDGHRWLAAGRYAPGRLCFDAFRFGTGGCTNGARPLASAAGPPLLLVLADGTAPQVDVWQVRSDIAYVRVSLRNGQVLTLRPQAVFGSRYAPYVALALPDGRAIAEVVAYSARGEIAFAMPFDAGDINTARWLRPGQPALPLPRRYRIGSGRTGGSVWSFYASIGPWGTCFSGRGFGTTCYPTNVSALHGAKAAKPVVVAFHDSQFGFAVIVVSPAVSTLTVQAGGYEVRVTPVTVGDGTLYCFFVGSGQTAGWTAYSPAGSVLGSGQVP